MDDLCLLPESWRHYAVITVEARMVRSSPGFQAVDPGKEGQGRGAFPALPHRLWQDGVDGEKATSNPAAGQRGRQFGPGTLGRVGGGGIMTDTRKEGSGN